MTVTIIVITIINKVESREKLPSFNHIMTAQDTPRDNVTPNQPDLCFFGFPFLPGKSH